MFRILNYVSKLSVRKETETHLVAVCPVCGDDNLKIKKSGRHGGAYKCWSNGCPLEKIRESLGYKDSIFVVKKPQPIRIKPRPVDFTGTKLIEVKNYEPIIPSTKAFIGDYTTETREYGYSPTQRVLRIDNLGTGSKYIYIQVLNDDFTWVCGSGGRFWDTYTRGLDLPNAIGDTLLFVEGEKTAEFCKERGVAAITLMAGNFGSKISRNLLLLPNNITNIIYVPDFDSAGKLKAKKVQEACWKVGLGCKIIPMDEVVPDPKDGYDLADCLNEFPNFIYNVKRNTTRELIAPGYCPHPSDV